jgi:hypothetical protein
MFIISAYFITKLSSHFITAFISSRRLPFRPLYFCHGRFYGFSISSPERPTVAFAALRSLLNSDVSGDVILQFGGNVHLCRSSLSSVEITERVDVPGSYSEHTGFKSRPGGRLFWQGFCGFPQSIQTNAGIVPWSHHHGLLPHNLRINLSFNVMESELLKASLNELTQMKVRM